LREELAKRVAQLRDTGMIDLGLIESNEEDDR